jgi:hypothetical protein
MRSLIFVVPLALYACGEDAITIVPDDASTSNDASTTRDGTGGGSDSGGGGNDSGGGGNDSATGNDTGAATDGGTNPNQISCGTETCNSASQDCCLTFQGGLSRSCVNKGACDGGTQSCDEAADCPNNGKCCAGFTGGGGSATCKPACGQQDIQICKTGAECAGGTCGSYTCFGQPVRACSQPPGCQ